MLSPQDEASNSKKTRFFPRRRRGQNDPAIRSIQKPQKIYLFSLTKGYFELFFNSKVGFYLGLKLRLL